MSASSKRARFGGHDNGAPTTGHYANVPLHHFGGIFTVAFGMAATALETLVREGYLAARPYPKNCHIKLGGRRKKVGSGACENYDDYSNRYT